MAARSTAGQACHHRDADLGELRQHAADLSGGASGHPDLNITKPPKSKAQPRFQRIFYITLPHLYPTMVVTFMLQVIAVVQIFTEPFLLTQGGPGNATLTPVLVIYRKAFLNNDFGLASAWSLSLIVVLSIFSLVYMRLSRRTGQ